MKRVKRIAVFVAFVLLSMIVLTSCTAKPIKNEDLQQNENAQQVIYSLTENSDENFSENYEYYNRSGSDDNILLEVIETCDSYKIKNVSFDEEVVHVAYSFDYDLNSNVISVIVTTSTDDEVLDIQQLTVYPFVYEDGTVDALIYLSDGTTVYLSEIYDGKIENCFVLTLGFSFATLVSSLVVAAKVAAVITAVVVIGGVSIQLYQMTKEKVEEKIREAESEKSKKNPAYYYPATRKEGKLLISVKPHGLNLASQYIINGQDYWSPYDYTAKKLAVVASGGYVGPERHGNAGYYNHFHLANHIGGHSFYGKPYGGVY